MNITEQQQAGRAIWNAASEEQRAQWGEDAIRWGAAGESLFLYVARNAKPSPPPAVSPNPNTGPLSAEQKRELRTLHVRGYDACSCNWSNPCPTIRLLDEMENYPEVGTFVAYFQSMYALLTEAAGVFALHLEHGLPIPPTSQAYRLDSEIEKLLGEVDGTTAAKEQIR